MNALFTIPRLHCPDILLHASSLVNKSLSHKRFTKCEMK